jgi:hypothetical protein
MFQSLQLLDTFLFHNHSSYTSACSKRNSTARFFRETLVYVMERYSGSSELDSVTQSFIDAI